MSAQPSGKALDLVMAALTAEVGAYKARLCAQVMGLTPLSRSVMLATQERNDASDALFTYLTDLEQQVANAGAVR